jgi:hypothetical protein
VPEELSNKQNLQKVCGIFQIVIGLLSISLNIAGARLNAALYFLYTGVWGPVLFIFIAGTLGIQSAKTREICLTVGCMIMSIFSSLVAVTMFSVATVATLLERSYRVEVSWDPSMGYCIDRYGGYSYGKYNDTINQCWPEESIICARITVDVLLALLGVSEFVVAIVQSGVCCSMYCCGRRHRVGILPQQVFINNIPQGNSFQNPVPMMHQITPVNFASEPIIIPLRSSQPASQVITVMMR